MIMTVLMSLTHELHETTNHGADSSQWLRKLSRFGQKRSTKWLYLWEIRSFTLWQRVRLENKLQSRNCALDIMLAVGRRRWWNVKKCIYSCAHKYNLKLMYSPFHFIQLTAASYATCCTLYSTTTVWQLQLLTLLFRLQLFQSIFSLINWSIWFKKLSSWKKYCLKAEIRDMFLKGLPGYRYMMILSNMVAHLWIKLLNSR